MMKPSSARAITGNKNQKLFKNNYSSAKPQKQNNFNYMNKTKIDDDYK